MARILLVEDEPLIGAMTEEWLGDLGHEVVGPAIDGASALRLAEAEIDAAIVDLSLGRDNGYPVADILIARRVPFAFATGYEPEALKPEYRGYPTLSKPYEFDTFRRMVESLLATAL
jgi:CheY-like chemotaxis protein